MAYTHAMTVYAIKCLLLPDLPNNDGLFRPIRVSAPEGTLLNPTSPAPVGGRSCTGHYVPILIFGALQFVLPDRVMAGAGSPLWIANLSGIRSDGKPFATVLFYNGGMGATAGKDGSSAMSWPSNISPTPVEVAERDSPIFFQHKRLRPGSGGKGRTRGGLGEEICFVNKHEGPLSIVFLTERLRVPAPGLGGGGDGACGEVLINGLSVDSRRPHVLAPGDEVILRTPGGGGYGASSERSEALTSYDRLHQYI
jgi:N-methylhydantoinase B